MMRTMQRNLRDAAASSPGIVVSSESDPAAWDSYVMGHPVGTVDHLWGWRGIFRRVFGYDSEYLAARSAGKIVGVLPVVLFNSRIFGRSVISLPMLNYGGLLVDSKDAAECLLTRAAEVAHGFHASHIELRHRSRMTDLPMSQHRVSVQMVLPKDSDSLWKGLDRKVRNQVRKAQKSGFEVAWGGIEAVEDFYRVFSENMRDLGTPVYSKRLFHTVLDAFSERAQVCIVLHQGKPVAGAVTLLMNGTVLVPWASSLKTYRHMCPNMLLYWSMIEMAISKGVGIFDFGRSAPDAGTLQFKLQWGAAPEPQCWEYMLINGRAIPEHGPSNVHFNMAIDAWKRLPLPLANFAGPHIVRNIP
jgi:FemAB-related protein (PEP-CTERM system-associated)